MIKKSVTPGGVVRLLNDMLKIDKDAVTALCSQRIDCNRELADHPTVQVWGMDGECKVGLIGILNGIFGIAKDGSGAIAADFEVVCPNGHDAPDGSTIRDNCCECGDRYKLGDIVRFRVVRKAGD